MASARPPMTFLVRRLSAARWAAAAAIVTSLVVPLTVAPAGSARADDSQVTVEAPAGGTVTVEKTENLVNEVVSVTWDGFTPSDNPLSESEIFSPENTRFPVRVYQCRTDAPTSPSDCYGSAVFNYPGRPDNEGDVIIPNEFYGQPDGPYNRRDAQTRADGTGGVEIEVMTKLQSATLGCSEAVPCSLVIVPNLGHPTESDPSIPSLPACATIRSSDAVCGGPPVYGNTIDASWAWDNRAVVPISFAPSADSCDLADSSFSLAGSPKAERAVTSWQGFTCSSTTPLQLSYTSLSETQSRSSFLDGSLDVALTIRPVDESRISAETRKFAYAPISTSSVVVAFHVDDRATGAPIENMRLNPRLIVKLLTESYGYDGWGLDGGTFGNPAVLGNPITIFDDPEFLELNPEVTWPSGPANSCAAPMLLADVSDLTYELTRFLVQDPAALAFLEGEADEWGMEINTHFLDMTPYPTSLFELRDPYDRLVPVFQPVLGLTNLARKLSADTYSGRYLVVDPGPGQPPFQKCGTDGYAVQGSRNLIAIVDSANANAYRFPLAEILNAGGDYVAPTPASMALGVDEMIVNEDGVTRSPDPASASAGAYPLTLIDYAMVPTAGVEPGTAEQIAKFLDYASGSGQDTAQLYGGLPGGYLALGPDLVAETKAAAAAVRAQDGIAPTTTPPTSSTPPSTPGTGSTSGTGVVVPPAANGAVPTPAAGAVPGAGAPTTGAVPTTSAPALGGFRPVSSETPGWLSVALPVVLFAGLAAAALGALGSVLLARGGIAVPRLPWQRRGAERTTKPVK